MSRGPESKEALRLEREISIQYFKLRQIANDHSFRIAISQEFKKGLPQKTFVQPAAREFEVLSSKFEERRVELSNFGPHW